MIQVLDLLNLLFILGSLFIVIEVDLERFALCFFVNFEGLDEHVSKAVSALVLPTCSFENNFLKFLHIVVLKTLPSFRNTFFIAFFRHLLRVLIDDLAC